MPSVPSWPGYVMIEADEWPYKREREATWPRRPGAGSAADTAGGFDGVGR
jgi:hypothetical protein